VNFWHSTLCSLTHNQRAGYKHSTGTSSGYILRQHFPGFHSKWTTGLFLLVAAHMAMASGTIICNSATHTPAKLTTLESLVSLRSLLRLPDSCRTLPVWNRPKYIVQSRLPRSGNPIPSTPEELASDQEISTGMHIK